VDAARQRVEVAGERKADPRRRLLPGWQADVLRSGDPSSPKRGGGKQGSERPVIRDASHRPCMPAGRRTVTGVTWNHFPFQGTFRTGPLLAVRCSDGSGSAPSGSGSWRSCAGKLRSGISWLPGRASVSPSTESCSAFPTRCPGPAGNTEDNAHSAIGRIARGCWKSDGRIPDTVPGRIPAGSGTARRRSGHAIGAGAGCRTADMVRALAYSLPQY
jgi:hypothetical protein